MSIPSLETIEGARARLAGRLHLTPMLGTRFLAEASGVASLRLKCESLQKTGSFKVRGALNAVAQLDAASRARGVVTVSAGNHAQSVAWAATSEGVQSTVVMPAKASPTKIAASKGYGAEVMLHGTGAEAFAKAEALAAERGMVFIHPFDAAEVIAGAATCGAEIAEQAADAEVVVVPIGGGGLIAGVSSALRRAGSRARVVGVEPTGANAMYESLRAGRPMRLSSPPSTVADGLAAPMAGDVCFSIVRELVDDVVLVSDAEILAAVPALLTRTKLLAEPAGAAAVGALLAGKVPGVSGRRVVAIISGGNVDLDRLKEML